MTKQETVKLFAIISALYPRETAFKSAATETVIVWQSMLVDIPFNIAQAAIKAAAATSPFLPAISEIRKWSVRVMNHDYMEPDQAWGLAREILHDYATSDLIKGGRIISIREQNLRLKERSNAEVWGILDRMGIRDILQSENMDVVRGQFLRLWDAKQEHKHEMAVLPDDIRLAISTSSEKLLEGEA